MFKLISPTKNGLTHFYYEKKILGVGSTPSSVSEDGKVYAATSDTHNDFYFLAGFCDGAGANKREIANLFLGRMEILGGTKQSNIPIPNGTEIFTDEIENSFVIYGHSHGAKATKGFVLDSALPQEKSAYTLFKIKPSK